MVLGAIATSPSRSSEATCVPQQSVYHERLAPQDSMHQSDSSTVAGWQCDRAGEGPCCTVMSTPFEMAHVAQSRRRVVARAVPSA